MIQLSSFPPRMTCSTIQKILRHMQASPLLSVCAAAVLLSACREQDTAAPEAVDSPGRTVVFDSMSKSVNPTALESMRWRDVAPTAEACKRHGLVDEALKVSKSLAPPPVIYLRGLLMFSKDDALSAANEWARIDVAALPPDLLYAPWHLLDSFQTEWNRYEAPLVRAVNENTVSPLIRARYLGGQGDWQEALESYLLTDPSAWTPFDVRIFAILKLHGPCTPDVQALVSGALAGGRVSDQLRGDLARLIRASPSQGP